MSESYPSAILPERLAADSLAEENAVLMLTRALSRGDEAAWGEFHHGFHLRLRAYLRTVWYGPEEALDDLVQDTFVRAVKHMRLFTEEAVLWSWLTVLARSAVADAGRKRGRWRRFLERFRKEPTQEEPIAATKDLDRALELLPQGAADLIRMKYERELSVRHIAEQLKISEKAVESRLTRARRLLRKQLDRQQ